MGLFSWLFKKKNQPEALKTEAVFAPVSSEKAQAAVRPAEDMGAKETVVLDKTETQSVINNDNIDYDVFKDHYDEDQNEDYSHLSPEEARKELKERKEDGDWLSSEEYGGYVDAINAEKYNQWLDDLDVMTDEEALKWFNKNVSNDVKMNIAVWQKVGEMVAPLHERKLLSLLENITGGRVEGWVRARKKEGYFFTEEVYDKALEIRELYVANKNNKVAKNKNPFGIADIPSEIIEDVMKQVTSAGLDPTDEKTIETLKSNIRRNRRKLTQDADNVDHKKRYMMHIAKYNILTGKEYY